METKVDSVFISYRRNTSKYPALLVYKDLTLHGYDAFIDYESIDSGKFAAEIFNQIAARRHFVVILSPGCLDRTVNPGDWLKKEILYAIALQRNIVPLLFDKFEFEANRQYLTGDLSMLSEFNALTVPDGFLDEAMVKLRERFLKQPVKGTVRSAPKTDKPFVQKSLQKADQALQREPVQSAFLKYLAQPQHLRTPTMADLILAQPSKAPKTQRHKPATLKQLGRQPLPEEVLHLNQRAYRDLSFFTRHKGNLLITNKRLIFRDLDDEDGSYEVSLKRIASIKWQYLSDINMERLRLQAQDGSKYSLDVDADQKARVEQLIKRYSQASRSAIG